MYITINSSSRSAGDDSNFWISLSGNIPQGVSKVRLHSLQFYRSFYNVTSSASVNDATPNNTLSFSVGPDANNLTDLTCSIPEGDYDINTLIDALKDAMNAAIAAVPIVAVVTITINTLTNKLQFSISGGQVLRINNTFGLQDQNNIGLNLLIGFSRRTNSEVASAITGTRSFNVNRYLCFILESNVVSSSSTSYTTSSTPFITPGAVANLEQNKLLGTIPINAGPNELIQFLNNDTAWQNLSRLQGQGVLNFRFITTDGDKVNFQGQLVNITLEVI